MHCTMSQASLRGSAKLFSNLESELALNQNDQLTKCGFTHILVSSLTLLYCILSENTET